MASSHPRVQVSVDPELASAMADLNPHPASRSRLIRDLALRGAAAERDDRRRRAEALDYLRRLAGGEVDYDFAALERIHAEREAGYP